MRLLVVFCHPSRESFGAALFDTVCRTLRAAGHDVRVRDLYREEFEPVLSEQEWYYGPPAMLKGWLERVWLPGIAFEVADARLRRTKGKLGHIRLFAGITTSGSPWWWIRLIRDPGRSLWTRGLRPLFSPNCRVIWLQLYDMNNSTEKDRTGFLARVERILQRIPVGQ